MSGERAYRGAVKAFSAIFIAIGVVVLATTLAAGGGPASVGFLLGFAFLAIGAVRLWSAAKHGDAGEGER